MRIATLIIALIATWANCNGQRKPTDRELEMVHVINKFRANPDSIVPYVQVYLDFWEATPAEKATAKELIRQVKHTKPMDTLVFDTELFEMALKHGEWMKSKNRFAHSKYNLYENLVSGNEDVTMAVIDLLIDHGVSNRGHRKNLLNPELRRVACVKIEGEVARMGFNFIQIFDVAKKDGNKEK